VDKLSQKFKLMFAAPEAPPPKTTGADLMSILGLKFA